MVIVNWRFSDQWRLSLLYLCGLYDYINAFSVFNVLWQENKEFWRIIAWHMEFA